MGVGRSLVKSDRLLCSRDGLGKGLAWGRIAKESLLRISTSQPRICQRVRRVFGNRLLEICVRPAIAVSIPFDELVVSFEIELIGLRILRRPRDHDFVVVAG